MRKYSRTILVLLVSHILCLESTILVLLAHIAWHLESIDKGRYTGAMLNSNMWGFITDNKALCVFFCGSMISFGLLALLLLDETKKMNNHESKIGV